ncbi:MAG TPA: alpha/beta fold hydrolase [Gaiellaceae bacterium]|jgi:pimeloyl-ACP methyl ester carboxylesterase|nr:alpha/beta fold hydrolase [Gaiellaceae bacterium]
MRRLIFLPGALGAAAFWHPVGDRLPAEWQKVYLAWPGLGAQRHDPEVRGFDDLVRLVEDALTEPSVLVAQSMGGVVALRAALRHPDNVQRLVLVATSGGIDVAGLGGSDWRAEYRAEHPEAARWITDDWPDHTGELRTVTAPALLLWGDSDPISPVAVGEHLASLLPDATLHVLAGGTHSLAVDLADEVAALIRANVA